MLAWLFLLFVVVPLVELALLLKLADWTGDWRISVLVVVATGLLGTLLARSQGFRTYRRIQAELSAGRMPTDSLLDAVMIFVAGALLVTPGILTDLFGTSLLIPFFRRLYRRQMARWIKSHFTVQTFNGGSSQPTRSEVIDSYVVGDARGEGSRPGVEDSREHPPK